MNNEGNLPNLPNLPRKTKILLVPFDKKHVSRVWSPSQMNERSSESVRSCWKLSTSIHVKKQTEDCISVVFDFAPVPSLNPPTTQLSCMKLLSLSHFHFIDKKKRRRNTPHKQSPVFDIPWPEFMAMQSRTYKTLHFAEDFNFLESSWTKEIEPEISDSIDDGEIESTDDEFHQHSYSIPQYLKDVLK